MYKECPQKSVVNSELNPKKEKNGIVTLIFTDRLIK